MIVHYFGICLEEDILTLLVCWNHIDKDIQMVRVKGGSYDCTTKWKRINWTKSYELTLSQDDLMRDWWTHCVVTLLTHNGK